MSGGGGNGSSSSSSNNSNNSSSCSQYVLLVFGLWFGCGSNSTVKPALNGPCIKRNLS